MVKLKIEDLHVEVEGKEVLKGINLEINSGEIHALMGPNGSGKTSLSLALMGHPKYKITRGRVLLDGEDITNLETHEKVRRGIFLAFQNPIEISEVRTATLLTAIVNKFYENKNLSTINILNILKENTKIIGLPESILNRGLFEGFSGGEKKRMEILQMLLIKPLIAILDEPDSGVDIDGLKVIASVINKLRTERNT
ncbi:MAG: Fe-S cluster assembly ATPase SufC, partial [Sulfolobaceae archaeon]